MKQSKYRILHVFGNMNCGGAENRIMDLYRYINRSELQFDFLVLFQGEHYFDEEIRQLGGRIFSVRHPRESILGHILDVYKVMKNEGPFQAVHSHTSYHSGLILLIAKFARIENRIAHARTTSTSNSLNLMKKLSVNLGKTLIKWSATSFVSISNSAGVFLFGKRMLEKNKVKIIPNSINIMQYKDIELTDILKLRKELNLDNYNLIIGHVGRFNFMKNHRFLLDLAACLKEERVNFLMIMVGDGELKAEITNQIKNRSLEKNICLLGLRSDIPQLMQVFDVLILPSIFEGLGGVVLEAQAAGIPSVVSESVPEEVDVGLNLVRHVSLAAPKNKWINEIIKNSNRVEYKSYAERKLAFEKYGYSLENTKNMFMDIYGIKKSE